MKCTRPPGPLDCHSCHSPNSPKLRRYSMPAPPGAPLRDGPGGDGLQPGAAAAGVPVAQAGGAGAAAALLAGATVEAGGLPAGPATARTSRTRATTPASRSGTPSGRWLPGRACRAERRSDGAALPAGRRRLAGAASGGAGSLPGPRGHRRAHRLLPGARGAAEPGDLRAGGRGRRLRGGVRTVRFRTAARRPDEASEHGTLPAPTAHNAGIRCRIHRRIAAKAWAVTPVSC